MDLINEQTVSHFRNLLKHRQKQVSLDRSLVKLPKSESPTVFSEAERHKTEETPEKSLKLSWKRTPLATMNAYLPPPLPHHHPIMPGTPLSLSLIHI